MVCEIHRFRCEICNQSYETLDEAQKCEALGQPPCLPRGLVFFDPHGLGEVRAILTNEVRGHSNFTNQVYVILRDLRIWPFSASFSRKTLKSFQSVPAERQEERDALERWLRQKGITPIDWKTFLQSPPLEAPETHP